MRREECWENDDAMDEECVEGRDYTYCEGDGWSYYEDDYGWVSSEWGDNWTWEEW